MSPKWTISTEKKEKLLSFSSISLPTVLQKLSQHILLYQTNNQHHQQKQDKPIISIDEQWNYIKCISQNSADECHAIQLSCMGLPQFNSGKWFQLLRPITRCQEVVHRTSVYSIVWSNKQLFERMFQFLERSKKDVFQEPYGRKYPGQH